MKLSKTAITAAITGLLLTTIHAAIIRVPQDQPTITAGVAAATRGDTLLISDGLYNEHGIVVTQSLTLMSVNGSAVTTVNGQGLVGGGAIFQVSSSNTDEVDIQGLTITGGGSSSGATVRQVSGLLKVRNCIFATNYNASVNSIGYQRSNTFVIDCVFRNNNAENYSGAIGVTAIRCLFYGNTGWNNAIPLAVSDATNCTVYGNSGGSYGGGVYDVNAVNCIIWGNAAPEVTSPATVNYCIVQGGYAGTGNLTSDPLFVNAANGDFHLQTNSPAKNSGNPTILNADGSRSDMGAYGGNFATSPPSFVTNANYGLITNQQPTFGVATTNGTMLEEFDYIITGPFDHTTPALQNSNIYKLTISGRVGVGPRDGENNSTPDVAYMFVNWQNLDLVHVPASWICSDWDGIANRRPFPDVYNTNHVYDYYVMGAGTGLAFSFRDNPYGDNIGGFHVKINNLGLQGAVPTAPNIINQPVSQSVNQGSPVSFSVTASGTGLNYQWQFNTTNISGATNANYSIASATTNNSGSYAVVVSNSGGSVTSSNAVLTVIIPPPRTGTGTATLTGSFVTSVNITDGGSGYTNTPLVRLIGGGGSGAQGFATVSNGVVISITVTDAGYGYTSAPLAVIEPPFIPTPVLGIASMSFLAFSNLTVGGTYQLQQSLAWYWTNQPVNFTATGSIYTQMFAGVLGSGEYRLALNPVPAQAFATAQVVNGFVVGVTVSSGGSGYVTSPTVSITGGGGTNATAVSQISGGVVTAVNVLNAGYGYTNTPTIRIGQPPAAAVPPTVSPVMRVDSASLAPYDNYQIQFTPTLGATWENWNGGLFAPTDVTNSQYLFITNGTGFFRLQFVP